MTRIARELEALDQQLQLIERIRKDNKIITFRPNPPQTRMAYSDATYRCLFGANKVGKSTWGITEDVSYCLGYRPYFPEGHPRRRTPFRPPIRGMIFAETFDKADEIHTPMFEQWIPKGQADPITRRGRVVGWQFKNGSEILYATYEMKPKRLEGADKEFYHFDEPPPYSHWAPVARGIVVKGGKIWLTLTLLSEGWIWDEIWERAEAGDPDYFAVVGDIRDNLFNEKTGAGALREEHIRKFEKTLDDVQKEVRLHGKPQHLQGRVFKAFRVGAPWVVPEWDIPPDWPCVRVFDPALAKPIAALWARITPSNQAIVTDVLFDPNISDMHQFRTRVEEIERRRKHPVRMSLMDQAGKSPSGAFQKDWFSLFKDYGLWVTEAPKADKAARLMETAERFKLDPFLKEPRIKIFDTCQHLIWELKRYVHPEARNRASRTDKFVDVPSGPHKKDDDCIDCLLYLVSKDPRFENLQPGFNEVFVPQRDSGRFDEEFGVPWVGGAEEYTDGIPDQY